MKQASPLLTGQQGEDQKEEKMDNEEKLGEWWWVRKITKMEGV